MLLTMHLTRKCFLATHKDWKELEWFSNKGYIVAYSDNHAEVPQEVIAVYNQINTPELQEKCRQTQLDAFLPEYDGTDLCNRTTQDRIPHVPQTRWLQSEL